MRKYKKKELAEMSDFQFALDIVRDRIRKNQNPYTPLYAKLKSTEATLEMLAKHEEREKELNSYFDREIKRVRESTKPLIEKVSDVAEVLGWSMKMEDCEGYPYAEFSQQSPAGEDYSFTVSHEGAESLIDGVEKYATYFDEGEHAQMWMDAKSGGTKGVPALPVLVKDAADIHDMLNTLAEYLAKLL